MTYPRPLFTRPQVYNLLDRSLRTAAEVTQAGTETAQTFGAPKAQVLTQDASVCLVY